MSPERATSLISAFFVFCILNMILIPPLLEATTLVSMLGCLLFYTLHYYFMPAPAYGKCPHCSQMVELRTSNDYQLVSLGGRWQFICDEHPDYQLPLTCLGSGLTPKQTVIDYSRQGMSVAIEESRGGIVHV